MSKESCLQAARGGLARLKSLAKVSVVAETGAAHLSQVLEQVNILTKAKTMTPVEQTSDQASLDLDFQPCSVIDMLDEIATHNMADLFSDDFLLSVGVSDGHENADIGDGQD